MNVKGIVKDILDNYNSRTYNPRGDIQPLVLYVLYEVNKKVKIWQYQVHAEILYLSFIQGIEVNCHYVVVAAEPYSQVYTKYRAYKEASDGGDVMYKEYGYTGKGHAKYNEEHACENDKHVFVDELAL